MKQKYFFIVCFVLTVINPVKGQNSDAFQIYPPNAYALARYGDIPVDFSTGVPNVSIPLMSLSDKDINVDISLSYHATGIKVDQEATWVGLGWVLNAGGVITRSIRGNPDNFTQKRPVINDFVPDNSSASNYKASLDRYISETVPKIQLANSAQDFFSDGESDIYYYNFNGRSGKFFLNNDNVVCLSQYDDIKIEPAFTITDDLGIKYIFSELGTIEVSTKTIVVSWYLTKMISPSGGEITFEYEVPSLRPASRMHKVCFIDTSINTGHNEVSEKTYHAGDLLVTGGISEPQLTKIKSKSGNYIVFSKSSERRKDISDSYPGSSLKKISLYNAQDEFQKGFELNYGYFEAKKRYKDRSDKEVAGFNYLNYRLRLESVKEFSKTNEYASVYRFEYYGDNNNPGVDNIYTLPYCLSPCQDHWGYYNHSNNKVIFPSNVAQIETDPWFEAFASSITHSEYSVELPAKAHRIYGADREPNTEAVKAGTLNKIIYPTGGYTKFEFESNESSGIKGGLRVKRIETCDDNGKTVVKKYGYSGFYTSYLYIDNYKSYYHTYLYNPSPFNFYVSLSYAREIRDVTNSLLIMGVPQTLISKHNIVNSTSTEQLKVIKIDGSSQARLGLDAETAYSMVEEEIEGSGKTEYHYSDRENQYDAGPTDYPEISNAFVTGLLKTLDSDNQSKSYSTVQSNSFVFPYPSPIEYGWKRKQLINKLIFDAKGKLVSEDSICYITDLIHAVPNFKTVQISDFTYTYTRYYNTAGLSKVKKEVNKQYTDVGVIRTEKVYNYQSANHKKVTETKTLTSTGNYLTNKYYYPTEYGNSFNQLVSKNILIPIDVRQYNNNKLISGKQIKYNDNGQLIQAYEAEPMATDIVFNPSNPFTFSPYFSKTYYSNNLLQSQTTRDNMTTCFIWGYKGSYPIAEINNITYQQLAEVINETTLNAISDKTEPSQSDWDAINNLRANPALTNSFVTTYTYKPLIGIITQTDPRGITTYYNYDSFGRLKEIYRMEGGIKQLLQVNDYHYKNE